MEHQRLTIDRYDALMAEDTAGVYILPVLQGYAPEDYARHLTMYGSRLARGAWVGVGSICKRNDNPRAVEAVLLAIAGERPDLRLHGFGLKATALRSALVFDLLATADSMAWSYHARKQGRNGNDWREAKRWMRGNPERAAATDVAPVARSTQWRLMVRARGICPDNAQRGCLQLVTGRHLFCFACRRRQSLRAQANYHRRVGVGDD
jgi:hypothetical protein